MSSDGELDSEPNREQNREKIAAASSTQTGFLRDEFGGNAILLATLVFLLGFLPFLPGQHSESVITRITWAAVIIVGIVRARGRRFFLWAALIVAVPSLLSRWVDLFGLADIGPLFEALFLALIAAYILTDIFSQRRVQFDHILGGVNIYLLLGVLFARIHLVIEKYSAGSYMLGDLPLATAAVHSGQRLEDLLQYFSFTTLTTLGYGDIRPLSEVARVLSMAEAVIGQLFIAILIAGLIGVYVPGRTRGSSAPEG